MLHYCPSIFYVGALIKMCWKILFRLISLIIIDILSSILILNLILLILLSNFFIKRELKKLGKLDYLRLLYNRFTWDEFKVLYKSCRSEFISSIEVRCKKVSCKLRVLCYIFSFIYMYISYILYIVIFWINIFIVCFKQLFRFDLINFAVFSTVSFILGFYKFYKGVKYNFSSILKISPLKSIPKAVFEFICRVFIVNIYLIITLIIDIVVGFYKAFIKSIVR